MLKFKNYLIARLLILSVLLATVACGQNSNGIPLLGEDDLRSLASRNSEVVFVRISQQLTSTDGTICLFRPYDSQTEDPSVSEPTSFLSEGEFAIAWIGRHGRTTNIYNKQIAGCRA